MMVILTMTADRKNSLWLVRRSESPSRGGLAMPRPCRAVDLYLRRPVSDQRLLRPRPISCLDNPCCAMNEWPQTPPPHSAVMRAAAAILCSVGAQHKLKMSAVGLFC